MALLREIGRSLRRRQESVARRHTMAGPLQQVSTDCVESVVFDNPVVGLELVEKLEPCSRASRHSHGDRTIQCHNGIIGDPQQFRHLHRAVLRQAEV